MKNASVHLRPFEEADLELLKRFATDKAFSEPFEWSGFRSPEEFRQRWAEDGFLGKDKHYLAVAQPDETALGWVAWSSTNLGWDGFGTTIGILLAPEHRGRGVGTAAQRLLVQHLFDTTPTHRLCAFTEADNAAEQRSLEKCGFRREGVLRSAGFRGGQWRDVVVYAQLREDQSSMA
jgi:RimJ/RimL family protein N-acetyltransferase